MKSINLIILILCIVCYDLDWSSVNAKNSKCNGRLHKYDRDFFYCTKFSVGKGRAFKTKYTAQFVENRQHLSMHE